MSHHGTVAVNVFGAALSGTGDAVDGNDVGAGDAIGIVDVFVSVDTDGIGPATVEAGTRSWAGPSYHLYSVAVDAWSLFPVSVDAGARSWGGSSYHRYSDDGDACDGPLFPVYVVVATGVAGVQYGDGYEQTQWIPRGCHRSGGRFCRARGNSVGVCLSC